MFVFAGNYTTNHSIAVFCTSVLPRSCRPCSTTFGFGRASITSAPRWWLLRRIHASVVTFTHCFCFLSSSLYVDVFLRSIEGLKSWATKFQRSTLDCLELPPWLQISTSTALGQRYIHSKIILTFKSPSIETKQFYRCYFSGSKCRFISQRWF